MNQQKKLLERAMRNPHGLSFTEFQTLMKQCGWKKDHQKGSHQIWYSPQKMRISIQDKKGMAKSYQVRQFLTYIKEIKDE
jgi:predicted RNA binding protein YcfA (HicA-like mRNA interferase family)